METAESMRLPSLTSALLSLSLVTACGRPEPQTVESPKSEAPLTLSEVLPLDDYTVSSFRARNDLGEEGLVVLEYYRPRPSTAEIIIAGRIQRIRVTPNDIALATGGSLLRAPLEVGKTFPGAFGTVRIERVNVSVDVPKGRIERCVVTVEESQNPPKRAESTFCSGIGLTRMVVEAAGEEDDLRIETALISHGPRVDLRQEP